jgi:hypothetical protein
MFDAFLLRLLLIKEPNNSSSVSMATARPRGTSRILNICEYICEQFCDRNRSLAGILAYDSTRVSLTARGEPESVGDFVSGNYFDTLGATAEMGRTLSAGDDQPGHEPVAAISDRFWRQLSQRGNSRGTRR